MVTNLIASAIVYTLFGISVMLEIPLILLFKIKEKLINTVLVILIHLVLVEIFFNIKRFKKGFAFVKYKINNEYASVILINISIRSTLIYAWTVHHSLEKITVGLLSGQPDYVGI